jgi:hypothetical protein
MKVGIGSNLTLEATVNPDFGQIEADPAEVNLSVFETFFSLVSGAQIRASLDKVGGRHWLWGGNVMIENPEFEPSDLGQLRYAGDVRRALRGYRDRPGHRRREHRPQRFERLR